MVVASAGVQPVNIPVGGGSILQVRLREPGDYPFVTQAFADATRRVPWRTDSRVGSPDRTQTSRMTPR